MNKVIEVLKQNIKIIILILAIVIFFIFFLNKDALKKKTIYTIVNGTIERSQETNLYLLKKESLVEYNKSLPVISIIDQGKRTSKLETIATYKSNSYDDYQNQIAQVDKQIQLLIKDLPATYSADITNIEDKILSYAKEAQSTTSYVKMQEYKAKLDELAYRKIIVLANSTPDSSAIRDLINKREELVKLSKEASDVINAPISGIVTYKIDGLENTYDYNDIEDYDIQKYNEIISKYDTATSSEFGIKVVDNYSVYLLLKTKRDENEQYIAENNRYRIRITDFENTTYYSQLIKLTQDEEYNYCLFKISNEIDNIVDYRKLSCEVVWKTQSGMAIPTNAIYKDEEKGYDYVLMVYGAEYIRVPINIVASSDSIVIADNLEKEEIESLGLDPTFKIELYDQLVIE